ncbi:PREDICTED: retrovirus-related Pol polyprotein from transposon TNT 1-94 [Prunus mume]|uniref:Retrovirus-related Pol polyprotein from transposon TNT 1-94 n=1 Tax=Prunus mume TaxID=102107 RepID=A0ABM1LIK7_PRUMU|nr:PREDICTED: retrovirus-related Pol polyprotein from transposon TNT 1-94 [Prunus mume]
MTITLDNAKNNDTCVTNLKKRFNKRNMMLLGGEFFHVRCFAHVINLVVRDGIEEVKTTIKRLRRSVKYVRSSSSCLQNFKKCALKESVTCKKPLQLLGQKPEGKSDNAWSILNRKVVGQIRQWVDQSVFHHVAQETDAYKLWTKLSSMYERKTTQNKASVIRRLVNLKYRDGRSVTEHLRDFQGLINLLTNMKMVLDDELQALVLLSSLPDSWDTLVVSLSNSAPQGVLTLDIVKDSMFNEEARRKEQGVVAESEALVSEYRGRTNNRKFHRQDKSKGRSRDGLRGRSKTRKDLECYHCGGIGHMKRECRLFKREQDRGNEKNDARHTTATTSGGNEVIILCGDGFVILSRYWIVDSGASFHVTSRRDFFTSYTNGDFGNVRMGNDKLSKIVGR